MLLLYPSHHQLDGASPYFLGLLVEAHGRDGQAATGLDVATEALTRVEATGARWIAAELHRLRGELLLALREHDRAEACFRRALAVARAQGARMWELRAAASLARLWADRGERGQARDLLPPVHGRFTEGLGTPDLRGAKELLDGLG